MRFRFTDAPIDTTLARRELLDAGAGACATFEGSVRDFNEGQRVTGLEYEAFAELAVKEGERIAAEALARFPIKHVLCVHRVGALGIGDLAVWVGVSSAHRGEAFEACRYIIDEVKHRVPIWKKEHYQNGDSGWVNCEHCAAAPRHTQESHAGSLIVDNPPPGRGHDHDHDDAHDHDQDSQHAEAPGAGPARHPTRV